MILRALRLRRIAITSKVGHDHGMRLGKLLCHPMPNGVRLGVTMKQKQRLARATFARHDFHTIDFDQFRFEAWKKWVHW
jgi:hypothetical protein